MDSLGHPAEDTSCKFPLCVKRARCSRVSVLPETVPVDTSEAVPPEAEWGGGSFPSKVLGERCGRCHAVGAAVVLSVCPRAGGLASLCLFMSQSV